MVQKQHVSKHVTELEFGTESGLQNSNYVHPNPADTHSTTREFPSGPARWTLPVHTRRRWSVNTLLLWELAFSHYNILVQTT